MSQNSTGNWNSTSSPMKQQQPIKKSAHKADSVWSNGQDESNEQTTGSTKPSYDRSLYDRGAERDGGEQREYKPRGDVECYNCKEKGHISRNCPTKPQDGSSRPPMNCFKCGKVGHKSFEC